MKSANAWRQASYRQTLRSKGNRRLNVVIDQQAKDAIERLASYYAVSQREIIERFMCHAETCVVDALEPNSVDKYYQKNLRSKFHI